MPELLLKFNLPEESIEMETAVNGSKWKNIVWNLDQKLRSVVKYRSSIIDPQKEATECEIEVADELREVIRNMLQEESLNLEG